MTGSNDVTVSPDEKSLAIIYSYSTKPPELLRDAARRRRDADRR